MPPITRTDITGMNGHRVAVVRQKLRPRPAPPAPERAPGPASWDELADLLAAIANKVRHIPPPGGADRDGFHSAKGDANHELERLADWARQRAKRGARLAP